MPYPNEHSCRLRDPDDFQANSFRRLDREHEGKKYGVIIGKLKGESNTSEQAYRYNKKTWQEGEARTHCKDHDGTFEPAAKDAESLQSARVVLYHDIWAIKETVLYQLMAYSESARTAGRALDTELELIGRSGAARPKRSTRFGRTDKQVAILPLYGIIEQRSSLWATLFGGVSTELFAAEFDQLVNDHSIGAIIIDVDSPGGMVAGTPELARHIFTRRGAKPIIALVNSLAASAAFWIAAAADEIVITPSGEMGSVGVIAMHADYSAMEANIGVKVSLIYGGPYKTEGNPHEPLTDDGRQAIQARVNEYYDMFIENLAEFRGVSTRKVLTDFGQGRVLGALTAVERKMADKIGTLRELLDDLAPKRDRMAANRGIFEKTKALGPQRR